MYTWVVYLHVLVIFVFLIQHAAEIWVSFKLRQQQEPEGIYATYDFMPANNIRNLRITYLLIIMTGVTAGLITPWWRQGWMWTALGVMFVIWIVMKRASSAYLTAAAKCASPSNSRNLLSGRPCSERRLARFASLCNGLVVMSNP